MATKHIQRIKNAEKSRPGALSEVAVKRAKQMLMLIVTLMILAAGLIIAGVSTPGIAWG